MFTSPDHSTLYRTKYMIPGRAKCLSHFLPTQPPGPTGQKPGIGLSQTMFALYPGHPLYPNSAVGTLNPARCIDKKHLVAPHRDELETPLRQAIVTGPFATAAATQRTAV